MTERTFTAEEVNAALELAGSSLRYSDATNWSEREIRRKFWKRHECPPEFNIAALALGVLPDGWRYLDALGDSFEYALESGADAFAGRAYRGRSLDLPMVQFRDWPEAVRSGQADIANRLIAAHVELERRRAEKGG